MTDKRIKHRLSHHPLYNIWSKMRSRCLNKNDKQYCDYGDRGIGICTKWNDFIEFWWWAISAGWGRSGLSMDRTNNNGNYEPSNCRWVTPKVQANNRRRRIVPNKPIKNKHDNLPVGVYKKRNKFEACKSIENKTVHLGVFQTSQEASQVYLKFKKEYENGQ